MTSFLDVRFEYDTDVLRIIYCYFCLLLFLCKYFWYGANMTFWHIKGLVYLL